jgi:hypothetical protein
MGQTQKATARQKLQAYGGTITTVPTILSVA